MPRKALKLIAEEVPLTVHIPRRIDSDLDVLKGWLDISKKDLVTQALENFLAEYIEEFETYHEVGLGACKGHRQQQEAMKLRDAKE